MDRCEACDFVYDAVPVADVAPQLRAMPARYAEAVTAADRDGLARTRPEPATWSAVEYACHVRDVLAIQQERVSLALHHDRPDFPPLRRDERAVEERYNDQDVGAVLDGLAEAAQRFADALDALDADQWQRTGVYHWPETAERSMAWLARHTLHESIHHLADITEGTRRLRTAGC